MAGKRREFLEGKKFGLLTVIKFSHSSKFFCKCDCGNESIVSGSNLKSGLVKSCGCRKKKGANEVYHFDGGITAIEINSPKHGEHYALIDTVDYKKIEGRRIGLRYTGELTKKVYASVTTPRKQNNGRTYMDLHLFLFGDIIPKGHKVDHISNTDTLDNRRVNIRFCTHQQNIFNSVKKNIKSATSKYKGVYFHKQGKKYGARITHNNKNISLGLYKTEAEAAVAYNNAAIKYFSDFARLNVIT